MAAINFSCSKSWLRISVNDVIYSKITQVVIIGCAVAMVTYFVTKVITMCSQMIGQFFDTMIIVGSTNEEWL